MKSNAIIKNEIIEYVRLIDNHKGLIAILKFAKVIYNRYKNGGA